MMNNTWYSIKNSVGGTQPIEIFIDNEIGEFGIPARVFLNELKSASDGPIKLHINSPGGSLIDAFAIYDFIKLKGYQVSAYIHGIAASAATIVSAAASETFIGEHSYFFIHNPYFSNGNGGNPANLVKMKNDIVNIYHQKTGLSKAVLSKMMDEETLLSAYEALEMGFVDGIAKEAKVAALRKRQDCIEKITALTGKNLIPKEGNQQLPEDLINYLTKPNNMQNTQQLQSQLEALSQQLNDLLQQYFTQDNAEDGAAQAQNLLQQKDETINSLQQELARYKARRVDNKNNTADPAPDAAETARSKGWNYVSNYLQNHFR